MTTTTEDPGRVERQNRPVVVALRLTTSSVHRGTGFAPSRWLWWSRRRVALPVFCRRSSEGLFSLGAHGGFL